MAIRMNTDSQELLVEHTVSRTGFSGFLQFNGRSAGAA